MTLSTEALAARKPGDRRLLEHQVPGETVKSVHALEESDREAPRNRGPERLLLRTAPGIASRGSIVRLRSVSGGRPRVQGGNG